MTTAERLQAYYPFDQEVIDIVAEAAERQAGFDTYGEFFETVSIGEPEVVEYDGYKPVQIIDVRPDEPDETVMFYHLPMANPMDPNNLYQIGTVAAANPNTRIIAAGNPSGKGYPNGKLTLSQAWAAHKGDFASVSEPLALYAEEEGITVTDQVGYSYGADRAIGAGRLEAFEVVNTVAIEPVSVMKRAGLRIWAMAKLGQAFGSSAKALEGYVEASDLQTFLDARADSVTPNNYNLGLGRLSNLAVASGLSQNGFEANLAKSLTANPESVATLIWGDASELADNQRLHEITVNLARLYGARRVSGLVLPGHKHALFNDVHLQAALINQARR